MKTPTIIVWVRTTFTGFHRWKDAPDDVAFLRDYHRHVFHVKLGVEVNHGNRDVEFFTLKTLLNRYLLLTYEEMRFEFSCEQIATDIMHHFKGCFCTVSEDGENGATVLCNMPTVRYYLQDEPLPKSEAIVEGW